MIEVAPAWMLSECIVDRDGEVDIIPSQEDDAKV